MKQVNLFALGQGLVRGCFITLIVWVTFFFFFLWLLVSYVLILPSFWPICDDETIFGRSGMEWV